MNKELNELNTLLATTAVFAQKSHNIHWTMKGEDFFSIHKMTDDLYEGLNEFIDDLAEKIIMQGGTPFVTLTEYINNSKIQEVNKAQFSVKEGIETCYQDLEVYAELAANTAANAFTQPLLDEIIMFADKQRWLFKMSRD